MTTSIDLRSAPEPIGVRIAKGRLTVDLADGRTISAPLNWYPRLSHGTPKEWRNFELNYEGIHWPDLNEDVSVAALLAAQKSSESPKSLRRWLKYREQGQKEPILELSLPTGTEGTVRRLITADQKKPSRANRRRAG
jgi:hypothetical protein